MPDVIVVGAGAAGSCAAWVCAAAGLDTLLLTDSLDTVFHGAEGAEAFGAAGQAPDLLRAALAAGAQAGGRELQRRVRWLLEQQPNLHLLQASVAAIDCAGDRVVGVTSWEGPAFRADTVALCVGSFLDAHLRQGLLSEKAGKPGQMSYPDLARDLIGHGLRLQPAEHAFSSAAGAGTVTSLVLEPGQVKHGFLTGRHRGLAAAGYVLDPAMDFVAAARSGQQLGLQLVAQARPA